MTHETLQISTDGGKTTRRLPDTQNTDTYIKKLSFASMVKVTFDDGEWWEMECGAIINRGGMYQQGAK